MKKEYFTGRRAFVGLATASLGLATKLAVAEGLETPPNPPNDGSGFIDLDRQYGARGDDATDNAEAIGRAIEDAIKNHGGTIAFGRGRYRTSEIVIPYRDRMSLITFTGVEGATHLMPIKKAQEYVISIQSTAFIARGLTFADDQKLQAKCAIQINQTRIDDLGQAEISNCRFMFFDYAIQSIGESRNWRVMNNFFMGQRSFSLLSMSPAYGAVVAFNTIRNFSKGGDGIGFTREKTEKQPEGVLIIGNKTFTTGGAGLWINSAYCFDIIGNNFCEAKAAVKIQAVNPCYEIRFLNNYFDIKKNSRDRHILMVGPGESGRVEQMTLRDNSFAGAGDNNCVLIAGGSNHQLSGNRYSRCSPEAGSYMLKLLDTHNVDVVGERFRPQSGQGFNFLEEGAVGTIIDRCNFTGPVQVANGSKLGFNRGYGPN